MCESVKIQFTLYEGAPDEIQMLGVASQAIERLKTQ